jgi:O-antigen/teichoic acid export membrane protein
VSSPTSPSPEVGSGAVDILDTDAAAGRAIRGAALRTVGYGVGMVASIASVPFMIRHLGVVEYGYYITVTSIMALIQGVTEAGLTNLGVREFAVRQGRQRDEFLRNLFGLRVALTLVGVAGFAAVAAATDARPVVVTGTIISGVGLLLLVSQQTYAVALTGSLRLGWVTILELVRQVSLSAGILALVVIGAELLPFFWVSVVSAALVMLITFAVMRGEQQLTPAFNRRAWKDLLRETLPFACAVAAATVYTRVAVILMSYVSTGVETGLYSAAMRIVDVIYMVPLLLVSSTFPILARAARDDRDRLAYALRRQFEIAIVAGAWLALSVAIVAPFAIEVIAGDGFEGSVEVLQILAVGLVMAFIAEASLLALLSMRRYRETISINVLTAVVAISATLILAPPLGAVGGAIATVGAEAVLALACVAALMRTPATRLELGVVPKVLVAVCVALAPALLVDAHPVVLVVLSTLCYAAVALALGAVPWDLIRALRNR